MNIPDPVRSLAELLAQLLSWLGRPEPTEARLYRAAIVVATTVLVLAVAAALVLTALSRIG